MLYAYMMDSDTNSEDSVISVGVFYLYEGTGNEENSEMMVSEPGVWLRDRFHLL